MPSTVAIRSYLSLVRAALLRIPSVPALLASGAAHALATGALAAQVVGGPPQSPDLTKGGWFHNTDSDTVVVFVHGFLSDPVDAFKSSAGAFWPQLVASDPRFGGAAVFLSRYETSLQSGDYGIPQAADEVWDRLTERTTDGRPSPMARGHIIFVAHSTGGIVARYILEAKREDFRDKTVGLVLVASPSSGSVWANRFQWLQEFFGNRMARQLQVGNELLADLDRRFKSLVTERKIARLAGLDLFENRFILQGLLGRKIRLVSPEDQQTYFGPPKIIPADHFGIAKPTGRADLVHIRLVGFLDGEFSRAVARAEPTVPPPQREIKTVVDTIIYDSTVTVGLRRNDPRRRVAHTIRVAPADDSAGFRLVPGSLRLQQTTSYKIPPGRCIRTPLPGESDARSVRFTVEVIPARPNESYVCDVRATVFLERRRTVLPR